MGLRSVFVSLVIFILKRNFLKNMNVSLDFDINKSYNKGANCLITVENV